MKIFFLLTIIGTTSLFAATLSESETLAAKITGERIGSWLDDLEQRPKRLALTQVKVSPLISKFFADALDAEIIKNVKEDESIQLKICYECRAPQVTVEEDQLVISSGTPMLENSKKLAIKYQVDAFLALKISRTTLNIITLATLFNASTGEIISSHTFKVPSVQFGETAIHTSLSFGPGTASGGTKDSDSLSYNAQFLLLEELGALKGGINLGFGEGNKRSFMYINPTLGLRHGFGASNINGLVSMGLGFGYSESSGGVMAKLQYDILLGSYTGVGVHVAHLFPVHKKKNDGDIFKNFIGVNLIIAFGR